MGDAFDEQAIDFVVGGLRAVEIAGEHVFVGFDNGFDQRLIHFCRIDQGAGRIGRRLDRADHAFEIVADADRHVQRNAGSCPTFPGCCR